MTAETTNNAKVILLNGEGASSSLAIPVTSETAYRHYLPLLKPLESLSFIPVFTSDDDASLELMSGYDGTPWLIEPATDAENLPEREDDKTVLALYRIPDTSDFYEDFEKYMVPGVGKLLIITGYSFHDSRTNDSIASGIESGLRLLVIDEVIQYKQLAEHLRVSDIKHKARIEKMEFGSWNDAKTNLLSGIIKDELHRLEAAG